jgi:hypothetical protein
MQGRRNARFQGHFQADTIFVAAFIEQRVDKGCDKGGDEVSGIGYFRTSSVREKGADWIRAFYESFDEIYERRLRPR